MTTKPNTRPGSRPEQIVFPVIEVIDEEEDRKYDISNQCLSPEMGSVVRIGKRSHTFAQGGGYNGVDDNNETNGNDNDQSRKRTKTEIRDRRRLIRKNNQRIAREKLNVAIDVS
ncbi:hypothetical protein PM082_009807 [Marasmius tenuissimus]|nr:hypothetical protein PM082_009807 [Marasmius tenuissimus]